MAGGDGRMTRRAEARGAVLRRVVSGGQTGVDRAALDAGLALGMPVGGWCPRGRRAEDGPLDPRYPLEETPSRDYAERTAWNVRDADATLVLTRGRPTGGTALTIEEAGRQGKPHLVVDLAGGPVAADAAEWIAERGVGVLNVAGPRESQQPGIHAEARRFLLEMLEDLTASRRPGPS